MIGLIPAIPEDSRRLRPSAVFAFLFLVFLMMSERHAYAVEIDSCALTQSSTSSVTIQTGVPSKIEEHADRPQVVHPPIGETITFGRDHTLRLTAKIQNYTGESSRDPDILSPKSVNIHPSGRKFYVNSLEGGKTVVYSLPNLEKMAVICHSLNSTHSRLWAPPSGLFKFRHYTDRLDRFTGKPVESVFSHDGRYLWIPYYRRSFDINAQDPSALAVIDTSTDSIVRIMEAGVLPKMITVSPDGSTIAIAHWGDNTVGLIDASSDDPTQWKYKANVAVGRQLFHDFSLTETVDRDKKSGEALRGSVFTPDSRFLLVGCMSGGGIAVIDVQRQKYLGKLLGMMPNVRHIVIKGNWLYTSVNIAGYVQRVQLTEIMNAIGKMSDSRYVTVPGWQTVKVDPGARTLELSPTGDYIFVACNFGSSICIVDSSMQRIANIQADSYPVGLDISADGRWLISTSQGRNKFGGNCVDIFELTGLHTVSEDGYDRSDNCSNVDSESSKSVGNPFFSFFNMVSGKWVIPAFAVIVVMLVVILVLCIRRKH